MIFKSKTRLQQHLSEMVKSGYLIPEWKVEYIDKYGDPVTKATKVYTANFDNFNAKIAEESEERFKTHTKDEEVDI